MRIDLSPPWGGEGGGIRAGTAPRGGVGGIGICASAHTGAR